MMHRVLKAANKRYLKASYAYKKNPNRATKRELNASLKNLFNLQTKFRVAKEQAKAFTLEVE